MLRSAAVFFNEGVRLLIVLQGVVGHLQLRRRQPLVEAALGNVSNQQDMHRAPRLFAGEEVLSVGFARFFQPAKEVEVVAEV